MTADREIESKNRVAEFAETLMNRYSSYHHAKEGLAYAGFAAYAGVTIGVIVSDKWPPAHWGEYRVLIGIIALAFLWVGILSYLNFQLRRRRWAALRIAGCESVLANWATGDIDAGQLNAVNPFSAYSRRSSDNKYWWQKLIGFTWPSRDAVRAMELIEDARPFYPGLLVAAWERAEESGTQALVHERLIIGAGWVLFFASLYSCNS